MHWILALYLLQKVTMNWRVRDVWWCCLSQEAPFAGNALGCTFQREAFQVACWSKRAVWATWSQRINGGEKAKGSMIRHLAFIHVTDQKLIHFFFSMPRTCWVKFLKSSSEIIFPPFCLLCKVGMKFLKGLIRLNPLGWMSLISFGMLGILSEELDPTELPHIVIGSSLGFLFPGRQQLFPLLWVIPYSGTQPVSVL